jgi:3'(2'), 5'-bisphosphate nucleotidase
MTPLEHEQLVRALLPSVLEAGAIEMRYYRSGVAIERKADASPVTAADREAEAVLLAALAQIAPGVPVIAEEAVDRGAVPQIADAFFLVDPLDGTREFISRRDEFTVNVALVRDGKPVFGIVFAPALGDLCVTLGRARAGHARIAATPSVASATVDFADIRTRPPDLRALVAVASLSHGAAEADRFLAPYHVSQRRNAGSSLKFCLLACGEADIYPRIGPTMEWDTAAGHAILTAAGGSVTELDGTPFVYGKADKGFLNPGFVAWGTPEPFSPAA